ncbi:MAG: thermonuclease family protein [Rhodobacteraceae bacterium]|nr:thermonuclease family protein [Paracoccaceae bacterium]
MHVLALIVSLFVGTGALAAPAGPVRVVDADTWDVGGARVRLHGIDAPEHGQVCVAPDGVRWDCGRWATATVRARFEGRHATCAPRDRDRFGRIVARCHVEGQDVAARIVRDGLAFAFRRYSDAYVPDEKAARSGAVGLWAGAVQSPDQFRAARSAEAAAPEAPNGCVIKGNISASGERIYHRPGQRDYDRTRISRDHGERWFCSADAARAAGWRAAKR